MKQNEEPTKRLLRDGLFHRPYATHLTEQRVHELAKELGVNVKTTAYTCIESEIKCVFEVKP